jgi:hypothetical protein
MPEKINEIKCKVCQFNDNQLPQYGSRINSQKMCIMYLTFMKSVQHTYNAMNQTVSQTFRDRKPGYANIKTAYLRKVEHLPEKVIQCF